MGSEMCIRDRSYIKYGGEKIVSGSTLKILGFIFGSKPTVRPHIDYMIGKAKRKLWLLRHVKRAGLPESDLLKFYIAFIRPTLEYAAPTFHSMLTADMTDKIEGIQRRASKLIFGWDTHYDDIIASGRMITLEKRREELAEKFAKKTCKNPRFSHWFQEKDYSRINIRHGNRKKYEERFARTERLRNSPVYYMTRLLNNAE